jgi:nitroreductase
MNRLDAIRTRRSTRRFSPEQLAAEQLAAVRDLLGDIPALYTGQRLRAVVIEDGERVRAVMSGFVGSYGKPSAPHFVLVTASEKPGWLENAGFAIEHAVLDMTAMGIATCWIGGQATREVFESADPDIPADHTPVVAIAFGSATSGGLLPSLRTGRKALEEIAPDGVGDFGEALGEARLAPSAGNTQPARFFAEGGRIDVYANFRTPLIYRARADHLQLMNRVDIGIALAHISIVEKAAGRDVVIAPGEAPERPELHYMTTVRHTSEGQDGHR